VADRTEGWGELVSVGCADESMSDPMWQVAPLKEVYKPPWRFH